MSVKSQVLEILAQDRGSYYSGEDLAGRLNCSRAAVWKAVKALRQEGYAISAGTNKGYAMEQNNDILNAQAIESWGRITQGKEYQGQAHCGRTLQRKIFVYKEVTSTNDVLKEKALNQGDALPHGSMVLAEYQTHGKGRSGRSFSSPLGCGLYMSVLLRPEKTMGQSLLITQAAAVAVYQAVERVCGVSLDIKWINDLYCRDQKVCGILTEAVTDFETGEIEFAVVGMGIHLYDPRQGMESTNFTDGTIFTGEKPVIDRNRLAAETAAFLLEEAEHDRVSPIYRERNLVPGREILLKQKGQVRRVRALEILEDGSLLVENGQGIKEAVFYGEVQIIQGEEQE